MSEPGAFTGYLEEWDEPERPKASLVTLTECIKRFGWPFAFEPEHSCPEPHSCDDDRCWP